MRQLLLASSRMTGVGPQPRPLNVAHRGASADVAENTLAAIRRAIADGADLIEVDVQRTGDGALVLLHDTTLVRTTNVRLRYPGRAPWRVGDFTYDELRTLDAGTWKSRAFGGEHIPTLAEAVEVVRRSRAGLLVELKAPNLYPGITSDLLGCLREIPDYVGSATAAGRLVVQSFDVPAMRALKDLEPAIPVGVLGTPPRSSLAGLATWADQVNPSHLSVDSAYVDQVHRLGMGCLVWTVNRGLSIRRAVRMGVDGVITNHPDRLGRLLDALPAPQRSGVRHVVTERQCRLVAECSKDAGQDRLGGAPVPLA